MALVNYFRNPRFKTDSNSDGFADGIDNSWPSFEGVNKPSGMILPINGVGGGPLTNRGVTDYCQFLEYDYLSDEGSLAYIHIGETAAGSIAIKNITSVTNTGQPTTLSSTGHGLHAGERIEVTGITTSPAAISGQENVYDAPTPDTFRIDVNVTTVTDGVGTFQPKGIFTLRMMADHMLLNQGGIPGGSGTLRVGIDQMNSSGGRVGNVSGGTVYYNFAAPDTWQTLSAYIPTLDATCDHLRFWIQLASLGTTGERIRMWISHACFTKMNGGLNWFDGVYGGTWDGTADASTSTQDEIAVVETVTPQGAIAGRPFSFMGSDFGWSGTMVWDATPVTATNWEPNVVSGTVPNIADGHYDVVFTPAEGGGAINYSAPGEIDVGTSVVVTSITPNSGVAGTPFVIAGSGLGTSGTVRFTSGSISRDATITSWNDTEIRGTAPTGLPTGAATVNVLIGGTTSSNLTYTYPATGSYELKVKTASLWQNQPVLWTREASSMDDADYLKVKGSVWEANAIKLPADPPPPPPPPPDEHADGTIYTVTTFSTDAVQTALNNCNPYDVVQLLPGKYVRGLTTVRVPDYVRLRGAGIYKQSVPGGDGGTWLDASLRWGSFCRIGVAGNANKGFLCGYNQAGRGSLHFAEWKGTTQPKFPYTTAHGCEGTQLNYVRFKGGGDGTLYTVQLRLAGGAPGATVQYRGDGGELFGNGNGYRRYWKSDSLSGAFLVDCKFTDCEFERPQGSSLVSQPFPFASGCAYVKTNSDGSTQLAPNINWPHGNPGSLCDIWVDSRAGGNEVRGNVWERCHFGVRNHYISGTDGYGMGITLLNQPCPTQPQDLSLYATRPEEFGWSLDGGSAINSRSVNKTFDRSQITHCPRDNSWVDCLFEWSTWVPIDICDWARNFSTATGSLNWLAGDYGNVPEYYTIDGVTRPTHALYGWGNPPGANWTQIPEQFWTSSLFRRCYVKGRIDKSSSSIGEVGTMMIEYCYQAQGIFGNNIEKVTPTGTFSYGGYRIPGGLPSGEWPPADTGLRHPVSAIFNVDWTGGVTAYTPSPFD